MIIFYIIILQLYSANLYDLFAFAYRVDETASEVQQRLNNWDQYLEEEDEKEAEKEEQEKRQVQTVDDAHKGK